MKAWHCTWSSVGRQRLEDGGVKQTASKALHELASCHLNRLTSDVYSVTEAQPAQVRLLEALRLTGLVDEEQIAAKLAPR